MTQNSGGTPPEGGLSATLSDAIASAAVSALPGILQAVFPGGVQGLLDQLSQAGFTKQVNSWLGRGENQPITTEDLRSVLQSNQALVVAEKLGIPKDQVLALIAKILPEAVNQQSPNGTLQPPSTPTQTPAP